MMIGAETASAPVWAKMGNAWAGGPFRLAPINAIAPVLNVLRSDVAFMGARPERRAFVKKLGAVIPHYRHRTLLKRCNTECTQVNSPCGASVKDVQRKLAHALFYVRRRSLILDLPVLSAIARAIIFQGRGKVAEGWPECGRKASA